MTLLLLYATQGTLTLDNGVMIEGQFSGSWMKKVEIQRGSFGSNDSDDETDCGSSVLDRASELQYVLTVQVSLTCVCVFVLFQSSQIGQEDWQLHSTSLQQMATSV